MMDLDGVLPMACAFSRFARLIVWLLMCAAVAAPAAAATLRLKGQVGFVGEWAFASSLDSPSRIGAGPQPGYAGPLTMRHVGLCSANGPEEQTGRLSVGSLHGQAVEDLRLVYGSESCVYTGPLSEEAGGTMRCTGGSEVPIRVWIDP